jgi:hypothetical protein
MPIGTAAKKDKAFIVSYARFGRKKFVKNSSKILDKRISYMIY